MTKKQITYGVKLPQIKELIECDESAWKMDSMMEDEKKKC